MRLRLALLVVLVLALAAIASAPVMLFMGLLPMGAAALVALATRVRGAAGRRRLHLTAPR